MIKHVFVTIDLFSIISRLNRKIKGLINKMKRSKSFTIKKEKIIIVLQ